VLITCQRVGGVRVIQAALVLPPGGQIWPSIVSLDAQLYLPHRVARICLWWSDYHRQSFFSSFLSPDK